MSRPCGSRGRSLKPAPRPKDMVLIFNKLVLLFLLVVLCPLFAKAPTKEKVEERQVKAEQGFSWAQYNLALSYELQKGDGENTKKTIYWYTKSAAQGHDKAQYNLGVIYLDGHAAIRNLKKAVYWFDKAAMQGSADAQYHLGRLYYKGEGVPQDYILAHMWFNLAAANDKPEARKKRDELNHKMTKEKIAEAKKLASEWRPKKTKSLMGHTQ